MISDGYPRKTIIVTSSFCIAVVAGGIAALAYPSLTGGTPDIAMVILAPIFIVIGGIGLIFTLTFRHSLLPDRLEQASLFSRKSLPLREVAGLYDERQGLFWVVHRNDPSRDVLLDRAHLRSPGWSGWINGLKPLDRTFMDQRRPNTSR